MKNILIIEDEKAMRKIIKDYLHKENFSIIEAEDGDIGLKLFYEKQVDLVVLDIMIPKYDGWSLCRKIRENSNVPIVMLTARSEESDVIFGLELGADEYITKPFSPKILVAKINALFRRIDSNPKNIHELIFGNLKINTDSHKAYLDELLLELTPIEFDLLVLMGKNKNIALSRSELLNKVWGYDYFGDMRTVDTHIKRLRKKLKGEFIKTVRGIGYRFEVLND